RAQLDLSIARPALERAARCIEAELADPPAPADDEAGDVPPLAGQPFQPRPDPLLANDLTPWLLRRLQLACAMATELRLTAQRIAK
ncbi:MAG: protein of unknown function YccS/YhfK, partial [Polaromonas sp.]|nr:protein of unknown function YccS/YhfK [Polaromonas sp.]